MTLANEWSDVRPVRVLYNGSDVNTRKPSIDVRSSPVLHGLGPEIGVDVQLSLIDEPGIASLTAIDCRVNSCGYLFMKQTRLPTGWPSLPNEVAYGARFRLSGSTSPASEVVAPPSHEDVAPIVVHTVWAVRGRQFDSEALAARWALVRRFAEFLSLHEDEDRDRLTDQLLDRRDELLILLRHGGSE